MRQGVGVLGPHAPLYRFREVVRATSTTPVKGRTGQSRQLSGHLQDPETVNYTHLAQTPQINTR